MVAADPTMPRGVGYKKLTCNICGKHGHLDKDHRSNSGSNDRPPAPRGPKKTFRGKKGKKGRVNNTNGRTVTSDDDGDNSGWIGSVYAITGTQELKCLHHVLDIASEDSSATEESSSESYKPKLPRLKHMNCYCCKSEDDIPSVFSSDEALQNYLDTKSLSNEIEARKFFSVVKELNEQETEFTY
jgi:hypothetical protein